MEHQSEKKLHLFLRPLKLLRHLRYHHLLDHYPVRSCVQHMINMSKEGGYIDVRIDALRTLARMSTEKEAIDMIAESETQLQILLSCVLDKNTDLHRLATTILANVCIFHPSSRAYVRKMKGMSMFIQQASTSSVKRLIIESLRALKIVMSDASDDEKEEIREDYEKLQKLLLSNQNERVQA